MASKNTVKKKGGHTCLFSKKFEKPLTVPILKGAAKKKEEADKRDAVSSMLHSFEKQKANTIQQGGNSIQKRMRDTGLGDRKEEPPSKRSGSPRAQGMVSRAEQQGNTPRQQKLSLFKAGPADARKNKMVPLTLEPVPTQKLASDGCAANVYPPGHKNEFNDFEDPPGSKGSADRAHRSDVCKPTKRGVGDNDVRRPLSQRNIGEIPPTNFYSNPIGKANDAKPSCIARYGRKAKPTEVKRRSRKSIFFPQISQSRFENKESPQAGLTNESECVDLTNDSDCENENDSGGAAKEESSISVADLIDVTGSSSTGVSSSDLCLADDPIDVDSEEPESLSQDDCDFLRSWVGSDAMIKQLCLCDSDGEVSAGGKKPDEVLGVIRADGMGCFDLTAKTLRCLSQNTWLNDEVVNAYMALLSLRSTTSPKVERVHGPPPVGTEGEGETEEERGSKGDSADEECTSESKGEAADEAEHTDEEGAASERSEELAEEPSAGDSCSEAASADEEAQSPSRRPRCCFFSSFFYALLRNAKGGYSHDNVRRWAKKKDLAAFDRIFFPINVSNSHWCLAVVYPQTNTIRYYDSLGGKNDCCLDLLERYMQDEGRLRSDSRMQKEWNKENVGPPSVPRQHDGSSCGVFLCAFADSLSAGREPAGWTQHDVSSMRKAVRRLMERCRM
mmetsp:Transcript_12228/g.24386  ORF Transcript_12228/g.24386 Transcript_12228/m.24386 type:complete len:673 (+) Transcript_12228:244-2262(+)